MKLKAVKLREQSDAELEQLRLDTEKQVFELRTKKGTGDASEQPLKVRTARRDLARINTVLREREKAKHG